MYQVRIISAEVSFEHQPFIKPLILSTGTIDQITLATASVRILAGGREVTGHGAIYLSDLWAWPDPRRTHEQRDVLLRELSLHIASHLQSLASAEELHPLELGLRLHHQVCQMDDPRFAEIPALARSMCLSPFDAAIHDAAGIAFERSAFRLYDRTAPIPSADSYFPAGAMRAIAESIRATPLQSLPAWLLVGKSDDLETDTRQWIREGGYRRFKLKVIGRDNPADVKRTVEVFDAVRKFGVSSPCLSIDSNEANPDADSVLDYLNRLKQASPAAFDALHYVEQPTGRDITQNAFDWRAVTCLKPVLIDEGLTDLHLFDEAAKQGWSGFAIKTCKGHSFALTAAAWALRKGMMISLQDLTNPGISMIHSALMGAYLPTINGVELNSPQFTPMANQRWIARYPGLFQPRNGEHVFAVGSEVGLGAVT